MEHGAKATCGCRITILKSVREALEMRGGRLAFEEEDGGVRVRVVRRPLSFADLAGVWREGWGMGRDDTNAHAIELRGHNEGREA